MKLRGSMVKKLSKKQKNKMQKTLDEMTNTRLEYANKLRNEVNSKIKFLEEQRQLAIQAHQDIERKKYQIDGALNVLYDIVKKAQKEV